MSRGAWERLLRRWLCHRVDVIRPGGTDVYGEPVDGERLAQVPCLIDGSRRRIPSEGSNADRAVDYSISFHREVKIDLGSRLVNGRDQDGEVLLEAAAVVNVDPTTHPELGELVRTVAAVRA